MGDDEDKDDTLERRVSKLEVRMAVAENIQRNYKERLDHHGAEIDNNARDLDNIKMKVAALGSIAGLAVWVFKALIERLG